MGFSRLLGSLALVGLARTSPMPQADDAKYFFVFGDSYTSTGFNINGPKPDTANPMGNPPLPGTTMAGGMTWAGHLTTEMNKTLVLTYDFAVAGATVDNAVIPATLAPNIPSMSDQVTTWTKNLESKPDYAPWTPDNSLFAFFFGVNDVGNTYSQSGAAAKINKDLDRYFELLGTLYKSGARRFVLMNIPPTQKTPIMKQMGNANLVTLITSWNTQLPTRAEAFKTANPEADITLVDTQPPFNEAINNPSKYGAPNANCENTNGKSCLWYDFYHPGQAIQTLVAETVVEALGSSWFSVPA